MRRIQYIRVPCIPQRRIELSVLYDDVHYGRFQQKSDYEKIRDQLKNEGKHDDLQTEESRIFIISECDTKIQEFENKNEYKEK